MTSKRIETANPKRLGTAQLISVSYYVTGACQLYREAHAAGKSIETSAAMYAMGVADMVHALGLDGTQNTTAGALEEAASQLSAILTTRGH